MCRLVALSSTTIGDIFSADIVESDKGSLDSCARFFEVGFQLSKKSDVFGQGAGGK